MADRRLIRDGEGFHGRQGLDDVAAVSAETAGATGIEQESVVLLDGRA